MFSVRIAKGNMDAGKLFVLKDVPDYIFEVEVGSDGELSDATAVLISMCVTPKIILKLLVIAPGLGQPILPDA